MGTVAASYATAFPDQAPVIGFVVPQQSQTFAGMQATIVCGVSGAPCNDDFGPSGSVVPVSPHLTANGVGIDVDYAITQFRATPDHVIQAGSVGSIGASNDGHYQVSVFNTYSTDDEQVDGDPSYTFFGQMSDVSQPSWDANGETVFYIGFNDGIVTQCGVTYNGCSDPHYQQYGDGDVLFAYDPQTQTTYASTGGNNIYSWQPTTPTDAAPEAFQGLPSAIVSLAAGFGYVYAFDEGGSVLSCEVTESPPGTCDIIASVAPNSPNYGLGQGKNYFLALVPDWEAMKGSLYVSAGDGVYYLDPTSASPQPVEVTYNSNPLLPNAIAAQLYEGGLWAFGQINDDGDADVVLCRGTTCASQGGGSTFVVSGAVEQQQGFSITTMAAVNDATPVFVEMELAAGELAPGARGQFSVVSKGFGDLDNASFSAHFYAGQASFGWVEPADPSVSCQIVDDDSTKFTCQLGTVERRQPLLLSVAMAADPAVPLGTSIPVRMFFEADSDVDFTTETSVQVGE